MVNYDVSSSFMDWSFYNMRLQALIRMPLKALPALKSAKKYVMESIQNVMKQDIKKIQQNLTLRPLQFHERCGLSIRLSNDKCVAARLETEFDHGYVFTPRTIEPNEFVVVQILQTEALYLGGLTFGVTSWNPSEIDINSLPENLDLVHKNVANTPVVGDMLIFWLNEDHEIQMKKNEEDEILVFRVKPNVKYFWFFDLYGSTTKIRAFSGVPVSELPIPIHQNPPSPNDPSECQEPTSPTTIESNASPSVAMSEQTPSASTMQTTPSVYNTAASKLMLNVCYSGDRIYRFEPIKIIFPNQPDSNSQVIAETEHMSSEQGIYPNLNNGDCNGQPSSQGSSFDNTTVDDDRDRGLRLQEVAESNLRNRSSNGSSQDECVVCCDRQIDCVLYNCGHMYLCYDCAKELWRGKGDGHCPYCRSVIQDVIRTYKSS